MTEKNVELIQSIVLPIDEVENNTGQVPGLNANPREITITEYKKLKNSLAKNRGFTALNELKVFPWLGKWITIGGNMRLQAMRELGWAEVIAKPLPEDTPPAVVAKYILLGNASFGKWDFNALVDKWSAVDLETANISVPSDFEQPSPEDFGDDFSLPEGEQTRERTMTFTLSAEQSDYIDRIIEQAKNAGMYKGENIAQAERHAILTDGQKPRHKDADKTNTEPNEEITEKNGK